MAWNLTERTTIGLRLSRHEAAEVYLMEELRHAETNPTCGYCKTKILRSEKFAQMNLISAAPTLQNLRGSVSGEDRVPRVR